MLAGTATHSVTGQQDNARLSCRTRAAPTMSLISGPPRGSSRWASTTLTSELEDKKCNTCLRSARVQRAIMPLPPGGLHGRAPAMPGGAAVRDGLTCRGAMGQGYCSYYDMAGARRGEATAPAPTPPSVWRPKARELIQAARNRN